MKFSSHLRGKKQEKRISLQKKLYFIDTSLPVTHQKRVQEVYTAKTDLFSPKLRRLLPVGYHQPECSCPLESQMEGETQA
jgi:hypothetical protein